MADEQRKLAYDIAIAQTIYIGQMFAGEFDPIKSNPLRTFEEQKIPLTAKQKQRQADTGIKALGVFLNQMKKSKRSK